MNATRRALLAWTLGCALPAAAQERMRRVALLDPAGASKAIAAALAPLGWQPGRNLRFDPRVIVRNGDSAEYERAARDVIAMNPEVVVALGSQTVRPLIRMAPTLPVVASCWDPIREGFADSLARPGRSVTGLTYEAPRAFMLMVDTLRILLPRIERLHTLATPDFNHDPLFDVVRAEVRRDHRVEIVMHDVTSGAQALRGLAEVTDPRREAAFLRIPVAGERREVVREALRARIAMVNVEAESGALLACSPEHENVPRALAFLVDKVLRGASPATLPFARPTHLRLDLNRATARALGLAIPDELLVRATTIYG